MKKSWILLTACAALLSGVEAIACTGLLVGKKASTDGSVMISYAADSHSLYGEMYRWPAATWPKGAMLEVKEWDTGKPLGKIAQVEKTYSVVGNMNEHQVAITESTFGGRHELVDTTGIMDYGSLIYIALQRSKSAREAIKVMTDLVKEYGYYSSGETFSIADKNEAWVMEMIGKGPGNKGAVWVAIRIPDDCISAHANQSRIQQIPFDDKENCMYSPDVVSFAREKGYFKGKDADFSFAKAYCPYDFSALRGCEARVWSFFRKYDTTMDQYMDFIKGDPSKEPMPLYVKPNRKLSVQDVQNGMRDHYEGTPLDISRDFGAGPYHTPYRLSPLSFYQVNRATAELLYKKAAEYAEPDGKTVLDLYCGAGTIGLSLAKKAEKIIGVEIVPQAVKDARFNAKLNGITNAEFICNDAAGAAAELALKGVKPDVVIVDPPRKGCSAELIATIAERFSPERAVYVSCDPATLARDIKIFAEKGYSLKEYTPVDMFPRTSHVETVVLMSRVSK